MGKTGTRKSRAKLIANILFSAASFGIAVWGVWYAIKHRSPDAGKLDVQLVTDFDLTATLHAMAMPVRVIWDRSIEGGPELEVPRLHVAYVRIENIGEQPFDWHSEVKSPIIIRTEGDGRI